MVSSYLQYYGTVEDIIEETGILPADMGYEDNDTSTAEQQLSLKIESWLIEAKAMIDADRDRDYSQEVVDGKLSDIPICINSIAKRLAVNMANSAKLNRQSPTIKVNDYQVKAVSHDPMTPAIKADLETCSPLVEDNYITNPSCAVQISRL